MEQKSYELEVDGITVKDFTLNAIVALATVDKETGLKRNMIHVVYSGYNEAFSKYFGKDSRSFTDDMVKDKIIRLKPVKGGVVIWKYNPEYEQKAKEKAAVKRADTALNKILNM